MNILDFLFPKNYIPYSARHVADYHYDALRSQSKYDSVNRPRGMSSDEWNDWAEADVRATICRDMDRLEGAANAAKWDNAKYYADHPQELKHVNNWNRPSDRLLQAARDYNAIKP